MLPFGVTIPATVPQRSEIPEGLMNYPVYKVFVGSEIALRLSSCSQKMRIICFHYILYIQPENIFSC